MKGILTKVVKGNPKLVYTVYLLLISLLSGASTISPQKQLKDKPIIEFVEVKGGSFIMGDQLKEGRANERPAHEVIVQSFKISKYEVTNQQFCDFLNIKGNQQDEGGNPWLDIQSPHCNIIIKNEHFIPKKGKEDHPVIEVSWYGSKAFAEWVGARLPTEGEWEFAASSRGKYKKFPTGSSINNDLANIKGSSEIDQWNGTSPVGSFPPNDLGIFDMAGNIWEWCEDKYALYDDKNSGSYKHPSRGFLRVVKGGSWSFSKDLATITYRAREYGSYWSYDNGFRLAQDL